MAENVYIGFGANLGDMVSCFQRSVTLLNGLPGTIVTSQSRLYETKPVGLKDDGPDFINAALKMETQLSPEELIGSMKRIELDLGKSRHHKSDGSRLVDLDLLFYDNLIINFDHFQLPHPRMSSRAFVLIPLKDIAADFVHPVLELSVSELVEKLPDKDVSTVRLFK